MKVSFTKMQGVGNDYVYVDAREHPIPEPEKVAPKVADRHFGVGSDGLVLLEKSDCADIKMRMFNADGSEGAMCGNAVRCIAKYVIDRGIVAGAVVSLETKSGLKTVKRLDDELFSVDMGRPVVRGQQGNQVRVDVGNPHLVVFCEQLTDLDLRTVGMRLAETVPGGVNVEFVRVVTPNVLQMRVWERGSGETLGCGTGAVAGAVASVVGGECDRTKLIRVQLPGGNLLVDCGDPDNVILIGPAVTVFSGEIEV